jgi:hypothetical protein
MRWVAESLGVTLGTPAGTSSVLQQSGAQLPSSPPSGNRPKDIRSFVQEKQPKSDNQYAAVVAYYYRFEAPQNERADSVNSETLQESTRLAGRERLGDPGKTLRNAVQQGYLDAADRGQYRISTVGENLVAMTLPGGEIQSTGRRTRQPNKKANKTTRRKM